MAGEILVAAATFQATIDGQERVFVAGRTTIRAGHPLLEGLGEFFVPLAPTFEFDAEAAAEPPPPEPQEPPHPTPAPAAKKAAAKPGTR